MNELERYYGQVKELRKVAFHLLHEAASLLKNLDETNFDSDFNESVFLQAHDKIHYAKIVFNSVEIMNDFPKRVKK